MHGKNMNQNFGKNIFPFNMNILFISEILPIDTYASEVVFYRHFIKLTEEGHQIHILTDQNSYNRRKKNLPKTFHIHLLPNRKWFYLPFKPNGILQRIRFNIYYYFYIKSLIKKNKIEKLIGFVHGNFLLALVAFVQKKSGLQLVSFFHDDTTQLNFNRNTKTIIHNTNKILAASKYIFIASEAFISKWHKYSKKFILLYPLAENDLNSIENKVPTAVSVGYSGSVYNEIIDVLDKFAEVLAKQQINFSIISNNEKAQFLAKKYSNVIYKPLFNTANEANLYLKQNCKYCVIAYPENIEEMPWIATCFPSKFIQNCILGIPTFIIAPKDSAIGQWCIKNNWILYLNNYVEDEIIEMLTTKVKLFEEVILNQTQNISNTIFNINLTHDKLKKYLL
jgi:hypothetical protein